MRVWSLVEALVGPIYVLELGLSNSRSGRFR
jgi:hypothetical protein